MSRYDIDFRESSIRELLCWSQRRSVRLRVGQPGLIMEEFEPLNRRILFGRSVEFIEPQDEIVHGDDLVEWIKDHYHKRIRAVSPDMLIRLGYPELVDEWNRLRQTPSRFSNCSIRILDLNQQDFYTILRGPSMKTHL